MPVFDHTFTVNAPLDAVGRFHGDTRALRRLTPWPVIVRLHEVQPLAEGAVSRFTLWVGPWPVRWTAVHHRVSERGFTDIQVAGPAARWEHTHTFTPLAADVTEIRDHIEFEHQPRLRGFATRLLFSRLNLRLLFAYRKHATRWWLRRGR